MSIFTPRLRCLAFDVAGLINLQLWGYKRAQLSLPKMYEEGRGTANDADKAREWAQKAAGDLTSTQK